jgi:hypothetical protein
MLKYPRFFISISGLFSGGQLAVVRSTDSVQRELVCVRLVWPPGKLAKSADLRNV